MLRVIFLGRRAPGFCFGERTLGRGRQRSARRRLSRAFCLRRIRHISFRHIDLRIIQCETAMRIAILYSSRVLFKPRHDSYIWHIRMSSLPLRRNTPSLPILLASFS